MSNPVSHFYFNHSSVRVQLINDEPWFCLSDVAKILDIKNTSQLAGQLEQRGISKTYTPSISGNQQQLFVNEPNLYRVIFRSNKPEARQFQDWVFNEVLPAIRKTGRYEHPVCASPRTTSEPLSPNDMHNLNHLVTLMSMQFRRDASWRRAIWFALRRVTGTASPEQYTVNDLPALAEECRRLFQVTSATNEMIVRLEKEAMRRIVRNGEDYSRVLSQLQGECDRVDLDSGTRTLERFERLAIERMERRLVS
ncbi:hypothetical protein CYD30_25050 [Kosakonia cowanii]|nr:hypothetical protein CYD30_25050 [Kosakonia cowanii]